MAEIRNLTRNGETFYPLTHEKAVIGMEDFKDTITEQIDNYRPIEITGNVTNAPDEEDITSDSNNLLKFKNRNNLYGLGKVILRRGSSFTSQVTQANTIYIIQYNFDLDSARINVPNGSILLFEGGTLSNGTLVCADLYDVRLVYYQDQSEILSGVTLEGNFIHKACDKDTIREILVDNSSITKDVNDVLSVKASGIQNTHLNGSVVDNSSIVLDSNNKISIKDGGVTGSKLNSAIVNTDDLSIISNKIQLADRGTTNGMGKIILRKDQSFASQLTQQNTIYVIRYDFTLAGDVTIPANCVLQFEGGSISGNFKLTSNNTLFNGNVDLNVDVDGVIGNNYIYISWFNTISVNRLQILFDNAQYKTLIFDKEINIGTDYTMPSDWGSILYIDSNTTIKFEGNGKITITPKTSPGHGAFIGVYRDRNVKNIVIDGLQLESSNSNLFPLSAIGLISEGTQESSQNKYTITNVIIKNCKTNNISNLAYIVNRMSYFSDFRPTNTVRIFNNYCINCAGSFVTCDGQDIEISGNYITLKDTDGYDAVSCHCGINIRILSNVFIGNGNNSSGILINVRNSPETTNTSKNVVIANNRLYNGNLKAIQLAGSLNESATDLETPSNIRVYNNSIEGQVVIAGRGLKDVDVVSNNIVGILYISHNTGSFGQNYNISKNEIKGTNVISGITCLWFGTFSENVIRELGDNVTSVFNFVRNSSIKNNNFINTKVDIQNPHTTIVTDNIADSFIFPDMKNLQCDVRGNVSDSYMTVGDIASYIIDFEISRQGKKIVYHTYASAPPATGTWNAGDKIYYTAPTSTSMGCVCVTDGTPGTWKEMNIS